MRRSDRTTEGPPTLFLHRNGHKPDRFLPHHANDVPLTAGVLEQDDRAGRKLSRLSIRNFNFELS